MLAQSTAKKKAGLAIREFASNTDFRTTWSSKGLVSDRFAIRLVLLRLAAVVSSRQFVKEVSPSTFGLLIAFLLPGFTVLWGLSYFSETVRLWMSGDGTTPTVGGFMFVTLASIAAGVIVSTVRWALLDTIHGWTGLPPPSWDFSRLQDNVAAYNVLNDIHYKFYQFHGNALFALIFVYLARRFRNGFFSASFGLFDFSFVILSVILFIGSRDNLRKYYSRVSQLFDGGKHGHRSKLKPRI